MNQSDKTKDRLVTLLLEAAFMPGKAIGFLVSPERKKDLDERLEEIIKELQQFRFLEPKAFYGEKTLVEFGNGSKVMIVAERTGGVRDE